MAGLADTILRVPLPNRQTARRKEDTTCLKLSKHSQPEKSAFYFASKQMETRVTTFGKTTALYCFQGHESGLKPEKSIKYSSVHIAYKKRTWGVKVKPCGVQ